MRKTVRSLVAVGVASALLLLFAPPASAAYAIPPVTGTRLTTFVGSQTFGAYWLPRQVVHRQPAYGYWPATCTLAQVTWYSRYSPQQVRVVGDIVADFWDVVDDGNCGGPKMQQQMTGFVRPWFWNYYGVDEGYARYTNCFDEYNIYTDGWIGLGLEDAGCAAHPNDSGYSGYWTPGYESAQLKLTTAHYTWGPTVVTAARLLPR